VQNPVKSGQNWANNRLTKYFPENSLKIDGWKMIHFPFKMVPFSGDNCICFMGGKQGKQRKTRDLMMDGDGDATRGCGFSM